MTYGSEGYGGSPPPPPTRPRRPLILGGIGIAAAILLVLFGVYGCAPAASTPTAYPTTPPAPTTYQTTPPTSPPTSYSQAPPVPSEPPVTTEAPVTTPKHVNAGSGGQAAARDGSGPDRLALGLGGLALVAIAVSALVRRRRAG